MDSEPWYKRITAWADAWKAVMTAIGTTVATGIALYVAAAKLPSWVPPLAYVAIPVTLLSILIWTHRKRLKAERQVAGISPSLWPPQRSVTALLSVIQNHAVIAATEDGADVIDVYCILNFYNRAPFEITIAQTDLRWVFKDNFGQLVVIKKQALTAWDPIEEGGHKPLPLQDISPLKRAGPIGEAPWVSVWGTAVVRGPWGEKKVLVQDCARLASDDRRIKSKKAPNADP